MSNSYDILFEPVQIGPVTAPNRFLAAPHATGHGWAQPNGSIALRGMKAEGGWGTVAVQITEISPDTDMANHPMERIWDDSDLPRHCAQVEAIKRHDALAAIELGHGGMRARNLTTGHPVIGPTALPVLRPEVPAQARAMDLSDIRAFRAAHRAAVKRAKVAGYDIIYVYAAHDISLLSNFLSPHTNHRTDAYGGTFEKRLRLLRETLEDTLEIAGGDCAVALRFSVDEPGRENGLRHDGEGRDVVEALAELPDLWDVNISGWSQDSATARFADEGHQERYISFVKSMTSKPVVGVGRYTSPDRMVSLVKTGVIDLIGAARPSIADPFMPTKIREDRIEDIRECIGCNVCVSMDSYGLNIRCTQNPTISEEWRRGWHPETPANSMGKRAHLVVGAGAAGLECALTSIRAGDKVTLAEKASEAGGRATREARLPGLASWARVRDYRLYHLTQSAEAEIFLQSPLDADEIAEFGADTVTLATGAVWRADGVGSTRSTPMAKRMISPDDLMNGIDLPKSRVAVYDDDHFYMGSVLAELMAKAGHTVSYFTPLPTVATWTDLTLEQSKIIGRLNELGVSLHPNTALDSTGGFQNTLTSTALTHAYDHLVFVGARLPEDGLFKQLKTRSDIGALYRAGDCVVPGTIQAAVLSGHMTARQILERQTSLPDIKREQIAF